MSKWFVQITGDKFELEDLPKWFNSEELKVVQEADEYYLHSIHFGSEKDSNEISCLAEELIEKMTGAARLLKPDFQSVNIGAVIKKYEV